MAQREVCATSEASPGDGGEGTRGTPDRQPAVLSAPHALCPAHVSCRLGSLSRPVTTWKGGCPPIVFLSPYLNTIPV